MSEVEPMIVPEFVKPVSDVESKLSFCYRFHNGKVAERAFYEKDVCRVYRGTTDVLLRTHFTPTPIIKAFYHDFGGPNKKDPSLCIVTEREIRAISIRLNDCQIVNSPFKIHDAFPTVNGLLLVKSDSDESSSGPSILFSLSHPQGEFLSVLCKFKSMERPFVSIKRRMEFIPSITESHFLWGYDAEENANCIFRFRHSTAEEKTAARDKNFDTADFAATPTKETLHSPFFQSPYADGQNSLSGSALQATPQWRNRFRTPASGKNSRNQSDRKNETATSRLFSSIIQEAAKSDLHNITKTTAILSMITGEAEAELDRSTAEFTLELLWSDNIPKPGTSIRTPSRLPVISPSLTKRTNRIRTMERSVHFSKIPRKPSDVFMTSDMNDADYVVTVVPGINVIRVMGYDAATFQFTGNYINITGKYAIPLPGSPFWICAQSSPPSCALYTGAKKIGDLSIGCIKKEVISAISQLVVGNNNTFEMCAECHPMSSSVSPLKAPAIKKSRCSFPVPKKRPKTHSTPLVSIADQSEFSNLEVKVEMEDEGSPSPIKSPTADLAKTPLTRIVVRLNSECTTLIGRQIHSIILRILTGDSRIEFHTRWLLKNAYRIVKNEFERMSETEMSLLFEALFRAIGIEPSNFPFVKAMELDDSSASLNALLQQKRTKVELDDDNEALNFVRQLLALRNQKSKDFQISSPLVVSATERPSALTTEAFAKVFKSLHELFDSLKMNGDRSSHSARRLLAQPLYIWAALHENTKYMKFYANVVPQLSGWEIQKAPDVPTVEGSFSPLDSLSQLTMSLDMEAAGVRPDVNLNVFSSGVQSKLKVLPTESEITKWVRLRWPMDIRLHNVSTMLDSTKAVLIPELRQNASIADAHLRDAQEKFLLNVALRTITRSFGAALLNYHSKEVETSDSAEMETICLSGKITPTNMNLDYPTHEQTPQRLAHRQMMDWANFYNGVSRGLAGIVNGVGYFESCQLNHHRRLGRILETQTPRLASAEHRNRVNEGDEPRVVDWHWAYRRIKETRGPPVLVGFVLAAGLSGQNMSINPFDLHEFLSVPDKFVLMSLLLGTSVAYRGTANVMINRMIYTHLPFLMQPTSCDFRIDPVVQTSALLSLGCLFAETMHTHLTNDLVNQMARETFFETDPGSERYAYVLAAGFAVGLINLCGGKELQMMNSEMVVDHLRFHERLLLLLNGGRRDLCIVNYQKDPCAIAQKGCCSCGMSRGDQRFQSSNHQHHHRQRADSLTAPGTGGGATSAGGAAAIGGNIAAASSHVAELSSINIHLSSPAACAALALIYMKTNDTRMAKRLQVPEQLYAIGLIRPDVVTLRTMACGLIMFDSICPTMQWVDSQIPQTMCAYHKHPSNFAASDSGMLARGYLYAKAGACFAMALKYTSSWNESATSTLITYFNYLVDELADERSSAFYKAAGVNCVDTCINVLMSSLAIVNAGSGDVSLIRLFRKVRNMNVKFNATQKEPNTYSIHVIANMAMGMLFLGNGRYGLGTSNMSLAALMISFFPIYGHSITDNRCYFQGARFLWTLAAEPRFLVTVAEGSQEAVSAPLEIGFRDENTKPLSVKTPYLLPPLESIAVIRIRTPEFQNVELDMQKEEDLKYLRDVLTKMSGRLALQKHNLACVSYEFRTMKAAYHAVNDPDLADDYSDHSFTDGE